MQKSDIICLMRAAFICIHIPSLINIINMQAKYTCIVVAKASFYLLLLFLSLFFFHSVLLDLIDCLIYVYMYVRFSHPKLNEFLLFIFYFFLFCIFILFSCIFLLLYRFRSRRHRSSGFSCVHPSQ